MSREYYIATTFFIATTAMVVAQMTYPEIASCVGLPIIGVLVLVAIVFLIIGIRKKESQETLILTPHTSAIGLSGMTGFPDKPLNALWLGLGVSVNTVKKPIDTLDLIIANNPPIPANYWAGKIVTEFTVYFNVTEWRGKGERQIELLADKKHTSGRIPIDFSREPSGRSHSI